MPQITVKVIQPCSYDLLKEEDFVCAKQKIVKENKATILKENIHLKDMENYST